MKEIRNFLLRLSPEKYEKVKLTAHIRTINNRGKFVSMQRVVEELVDALPTPEPLPKTAGKAKTKGKPKPRISAVTPDSSPKASETATAEDV